MFHPYDGGPLGSSRRHFLRISAAVAGRMAAGLPVLASLATGAQAKDGDDGGKGDGWNGWDGGPRCFLKETRILSPRGEVPVEELKIGDLVDTLSGPLPIKWIGRQNFRKSAASWHASVLPIRIARFALDDQSPSRDLYLSGSHSVFVDGYLIPVELLVNNRSIAPAQMSDRDLIEYFHIELETHEVVFAEGVAAETLLVTEGRENFANFVEYERLYGNAPQPPMKPFARYLGYPGGRAELQGLLRLALSKIVDVRDPIHRARDRIAARAARAEV
jgi:hypothetical protein